MSEYTQQVANEIANLLDQKAAEARAECKKVEQDPEWEYPHQSASWNLNRERADQYVKAAALVREKLA